MKSKAHFQRPGIDIFRGNDLVHRALQVAGFCVLYLLILFAGKGFVNIAPVLAVGLSWLWFILPGLLISITFHKKCSWWELIPLSFVLTVGLATPLTVVAILLHLSLDILIIFHVAILVLAAYISLAHKTQRDKPSENQPLSDETPPSKEIGRESLLLLAVFIVLVGILTFLALAWPMTGDDIAGMSLFTEVLSRNQITGTEPFHGSGVPVTPRNELIVATYSEILIAKISGTAPPDFIINTRPILVLLAILSLATLLNQFLKDKRQTLFLLCLWSIYLLASAQGDGTGSDFTTRIFQDKFLGWFVIVPSALVFMLWYLERRDWRTLIELGIVTLGASMVHPITLTQVMILMGGFGLTHFFIERSRRVFINLLVIVVVLLISTLIPFMQYLRYTNYMPVDMAGLGDAVEFGRLSAAVTRYRLWLLEGNRFILHPSVILQPVILLAYVLLPVIISKMRQHYFLRMIVGTLFILPVMLYIPPFAALAGKVVTPYLIWRLAWPLPLFAVLTIGWVLWFIANKIENGFTLKANRFSVNRLVNPALILIALLVAAPNIQASLKDYGERRSEVNSSPCLKAGDVLSFLKDYSKEQSVNVLSSHNLNFCIPGYVANANVVEYRGYGTINRLSNDRIEESIQRVEDVDYFDNTRLVDDLLLNALIQHKIEYILIERDKLELDLQLNYLSSHFLRVYEDANFRLYQVNSQAPQSKIIGANSALRSKKYEIARELFNQVLQEDPSNILALLGLGLADEGLGESEQAILSYQKAIRSAPDEPALHAQLAGTYMVMRDFEHAVQEFQVAIPLSPERPELHKALGEIYVLLGRNQDALASFEKVAAFRSVTGSASYYSILGRSLQYINQMTDEAIVNHEKAISIQPAPQRYVDLARTLTYSGETDRAIELLKKAVKLDRWNYLPHLELGYIYKKQGSLDDAIDEFETASRLNPANVSAYIALGLAIKEKSGLSPAIVRLEELKKLNKVLPGPYRSYAILMVSGGELESALEALGLSASIQPKSVAILTAKGYISMIGRQMDAAYAAFDEALLSYPDLISARLGLAMYYKFEADFQMETGQLLQIARVAPAMSWIHLLLAETYMVQGNWQLAVEECNWAVKLDPDNAAGYVARGAINKMQNKWELAIFDYSLANELEPQNSDALIGLGDIYQSLANYAEAEKYFTLAVDVDKESIAPRIRLADLYWQLGRVGEAVALEEIVATMAPDSDLVLLRTANIYKMQGRIEEAKSFYDRVIETDPDTISAYVALAQLMEEEGINDLTTLFSLYNDMVKANPGSAEAWLAAGSFFVTQAQFEVAERAFQTALTYPDVSIDNYLALSELQQRSGKWDEARQTLESAMGVFPGQAVGFYSLANYYLQTGKPQESIRYFDKALDLDPGMIPAYVAKSHIEQVNGNKDKAEAILQSAVLQNPGSSEAILALAEFQESISRFDLAEVNIRKALELNPADSNTNQKAALFFMHQKRYTEAFDIFQYALTLPDSKLEIYLQMGNLEMARLQTNEALRWYQAAHFVDQGDARPYLALANLYQSTGKSQEAFNFLIEALHLEPGNIDVNIALGKLSSMAGNSEAASAYFERARTLDYNQVDALLSLSVLAKDQEDWKIAISYLEQAIRIQPRNFQVYNDLFQVYQFTDDFTKADEISTLAIKNTIEKPDAYLMRAAFYEKRGMWDLAQEYYALAWDQEPFSKSAGLEYANFLQRRNENEQALAVLRLLESRVGAKAEISVATGNIFALQARWSEAMGAFEQAIKLDASTEGGYLGLGKIYESQGDPKAAIALYQAAEKNIRNSPELQLKLGIALRDQGKYAEAQVIFQNALELAPFNLTSMINLEQLGRIMDVPELDILVYARRALMTPSSTSFTSIAQIYQLRGEWSLAHSWLQRAINLEPLNSDNWFYLGNYYRSLSQWEKALDAYTQALKYNPSSLDAIIARGSVLEKQGLREDAQTSYQHAIDVAPGSIKGYVALAEFQLKTGDSEQAKATLQEGIIQVPGDYLGYEALGDLYKSINSDQIEQAEQAYQAGLNILPGTSSFYVDIGNLHTERLYSAWQKLKTAEELDRLSENDLNALLARLGIDGDDLSQQSRFVQETVMEAKQLYGRYHRDLLLAQEEYQQISTSFDKASTSYENALALKSNDELALLGLGRLQLIHGLAAEAVRYIEQASSLNPYSSLSLTNLGTLYLEMGRTAEAIHILEYIRIIDPGNSLTQVALVDAYHDLKFPTISQVAVFVEQGVFKLQSMVEILREREAKEFE